MRRFAYEQISDRIKKLNSRLTAYKSQNKALLEALEAVEWAFTTGKIDSCPVCHNWSNAAHTVHCKLGNALKLARGEERRCEKSETR